MMRFGPFEFDAAPRRLTHDSEPVHLTPKAFDLLSLLPYQAVSDATLSGLVKELRRALDDRDRTRRLIRTVHRVGYAFDAPLETAAGTALSSCLLVIGPGRTRLVEGDNVVGRDPACDVWIDNRTVSRRHARIVVAAERATLEDLGSKNGTRIGDLPLAGPRDLRDGDRIQFGEVDAVFRDALSSRPTDTHLSIAD
jgi:hypothetical protein